MAWRVRVTVTSVSERRAADHNANASDAWWPVLGMRCRRIAAAGRPKPLSNDRRSQGMKTWVTLTAAMLTATGLMGLTSAIAGPPPHTQCTGELSGPVRGDMVVPTGASCVIRNATITGNVTVQSGGDLQITATGPAGFTTISGNVKGKNCRILVGPETEGPEIVIGGDLSVEGCELLSCLVALIGKSITCKNGTFCSVLACTVGNNVECSGNISDTAGISACFIRRNQIGGDVKLNN